MKAGPRREQRNTTRNHSLSIKHAVNDIADVVRKVLCMAFDSSLVYRIPRRLAAASD